MSTCSSTYRQSVFKWHQSNKLLRVLPTRWRHKPAGIDVERNYTTVTLCIDIWCTGFILTLTAFVPSSVVTVAGHTQFTVVYCWNVQRNLEWGLSFLLFYGTYPFTVWVRLFFSDCLLVAWYSLIHPVVAFCIWHRLLGPVWLEAMSLSWQNSPPKPLHDCCYFFWRIVNLLLRNRSYCFDVSRVALLLSCTEQ